ncbi:tRNA (uridine(34)/cytosine(34)/5-carboxymethylaminomethyluridine(34)-2'-O)-methyltransferase TrmL [Aerococcus sanguinicola]|uniref:Putative tRNA (cytidine(34)-2'-O)-methyltransferase n=1 Tax=Aerococcus sanguinicola TaxID=119206 RepID=A0A0X8FBT6_9LACT|nr:MULTISPECIES: tRNA (uridine(34)/cytosine(34)/5-carboxymethylaminomethyluridine(34)-2'-O)-methyltransferase TrmL [Aerococcus]AMB94460.1 RNA methyltransferase [Aerococcus sanguinicola]MDK7049335.1 tRNA (uridine(34)/cytosine(34)/5-carboxymethylaminomethyluridine(34)-2'-O)-methyltransferase TrmL [Aerococcus sanguinicola]OFT95756.1 RNA methyltransferase [Aerococcus sp. HMSC23C02]PKZ23546.1 tRNA (uridine(34)/cytosine(34)/5-carboxymethylaminomethyluridine(34)-2'-O)-methyltransferase TrmL [Aerococcu
MTNHIVLYEPLIPPNTGNIARTCAATDTHLHLIEPLGFSLDDKHLKRAGLDYWHSVDVTLHKDLEHFMAYLGDRKLYLITKFAHHTYTEVDYRQQADEDLFLMFGKETTGLPEDFMRDHEAQCLRLPMDDTHVRALNLSNCAAIVIYEVLRQQDFNQLEKSHHYDHDKLD